MSDLAERILAAIQKAESTVPPLHLEGRYVGPRTDAERSVLRHCAEDRKTVVRCQEALLTANPMLVHFAKQTLIERARGYGLEVEGQ